MSIFRPIIALSFIAVISAQAIQDQLPLEERIKASTGIFRGRVIAAQPFQKEANAPVYTRTGFQVLESFKGTFADTIQLEHIGGAHNGREDIVCGYFDYQPGKEFLLFIKQRGDQTLYALNHVTDNAADFEAELTELRLQNPLAGIDASGTFYQFSNPIVPTVVGVLPGPSGYGSRFLQCDQGEPIEYLIDMDVLPAGITSNQAMTALSNAFAA